MRGVYASTYLGELADAFARKRRVAALDVGKGFDLIVGTSTGAASSRALLRPGFRCATSWRSTGSTDARSFQ